VGCWHGYLSGARCIQLMPLPLTVSCFSKIQTSFTFLVPAHPGSPGQRAVKQVCLLETFSARCYGPRRSIFGPVSSLMELNMRAKVQGRSSNIPPSWEAESMAANSKFVFFLLEKTRKLNRSGCTLAHLWGHRHPRTYFLAVPRRFVRHNPRCRPLVRRRMRR